MAFEKEGLTHNGRIVFALLYRLENPPPVIRELVVQLDTDGNSLCGGARPVDPNKRIVNLRPGDQIRHKGQVDTIVSVEVFASLPLISPTTGKPVR